MDGIAELDALPEAVGRALEVRGLRLATAESCTGGWIAKAVTDVPGSSGWFDRGFVTYANQAKVEMLGVSPRTLEAHGAVSEATVREMAAGALARSRAQVAVAVSGIAGPSGGSPAKPVGTVWLAWALAGAALEEGAQEGVRLRARRHLFEGDRAAVRRQAVREALRGVLELLEAG